MKCLLCGGITRVIWYDRTNRDGIAVRIRSCLDCDKTFVTREMVTEIVTEITVIEDEKGEENVGQKRMC